MFKLKHAVFFAVIALSGCADSENLAPVVNRGRIETINSDHYRVQAGDTLYSIAWASTLDYRQLAAMNHLKAPYALHPDQVLQVKLPSFSMAHLEKPKQAKVVEKSSKPSAIKLDPPHFAVLTPPLHEKKYPVKSTSNGANLNHQSSDHLQLPKPGSMRIPAFSANEINSQKRAPIYDSGRAVNEINEQDQRKDLFFTKKCVHCFLWPVRGKVVGQFSSGQLGNKGLDIIGQYGQPVKACESGVVVYSGSGLRGYGNLIIIKHNASFLSAYAHNSELMVSEGSQVKAGQEIALMGRAPSGQVMLHFEIRRDGKPVNPTQYLR
jgi:lipoprotein NlpD